jgi:class 3 adenylate cyclase
MATLIAIEVVNSTPAIELLHPATFSTLLQQYQFYLRQVARLYRGTVTQISGDRAVVSFDVRQCQDEHAFNALCCAQLFLILSQRLAASQKARNAQALEFKLTVHSGDVFFSLPWRKNKGEPDPNRTETMVGRTFTLAQELLTDAQTGEILVSELAYDLANGPQRFPSAPEKNIAKGGLDLLGYILPVDCGAHHELLLKQCAHLLPEQQSKAG